MRWVVKATPPPLYQQERPGTHYIGDWDWPWAVLDGYRKSHPTWIRSLDRPARSDLLNRLRYIYNHIHIQSLSEGITKLV